MADTANDLPPHAQLVQMGNAFWVSRMIHAAAELGLADRLAGGPKTADELAGATKSHPRSLYRLMRALAGLGVFTQDDNGRFGLTELGQALRDEAPGHARATILALSGDWFWKAWEEFSHSIATGRTAMEKVHGMAAFDYLAQHPDIASNFSKAMVGIHGGEIPALVEAYDFSPFETVVDVGGATGSLIGAVCGAYPTVKGVLYDMPHVVKEAPPVLAAKGVADRVKVEGGSFFERVPAGGDAYVLSHVIHDWSEEQCLAILRNVKKAMNPGGKVLVVEMVLPEGSEFHPGKMLDIVMLTIPGGEERTPKEYAALLEKASLRMTRVVPTASAVSVVEAVSA
ncbi:MAG TPA: methyltransferase [Candidatus Polarisedimenticolaceae bacterium]|nr:methyltransferase [Candidatus Polarisedimenticolaceae bacterium]